MTQSSSISSDKRVVDAMIQLARAARSHRMIVAGSNSSEIFLELHRRGYPRVTTTKASRAPCGQHDVGFVAWRQQSIGALEAALDQLAHFLSAAGVLVVWLGPGERMPNRTLRLALERLGFRIESGTCCENGVAVCTRRLESSPVAKGAKLESG
jgi:hypothetical protein